MTIVVACGVIAGGCQRRPTPPSGDIAAMLAGPLIDGSELSAASLAGKPALVMFVTPTCPYCLATLPRAVQASHAAHANAVAIFSVGKPENARGVIDHVHWDGPAIADGGALAKHYGIHSFPTTFVLGTDGHAREVLVGEQDEAALADALADAQ